MGCHCWPLSSRHHPIFCSHHYFQFRRLQLQNLRCNQDVKLSGSSILVVPWQLLTKISFIESVSCFYSVGTTCFIVIWVNLTLYWQFFQFRRLRNLRSNHVNTVSIQYSCSPITPVAWQEFIYVCFVLYSVWSYIFHSIMGKFNILLTFFPVSEAGESKIEPWCNCQHPVFLLSHDSCCLTIVFICLLQFVSSVNLLIITIYINFT